MKVLVIDTATEACSVALQINGEILDDFLVCPQQHSVRILPMVEQVLAEAGVKLAVLDAIAVAQGPGSFTGVRIAMGMAQGLAFASDLPIVGVSTLQAMAQETYQDTGSSRVLCAIDARMSEVYAGEYLLDEDGLMRINGKEKVIPPAEFVSTLLGDGQAFGYAGTGWNAYPELSAKVSGVPLVHYPKARFMLPMANKLVAEQVFYQPSEIEPVYLRDKVTWKKLPGRE